MRDLKIKQSALRQGPGFIAIDPTAASKAKPGVESGKI
jgi:hypothetical protein